MANKGGVTLDDIQDAQLIRYNTVAALTLLLWDAIIMLPDEVQFVWSQPARSPTKWVYLFTRYFGLLAQARLTSLYLSLSLDNFTIRTCQELYITQVIGGGVLMACTQAILMLRVYALWTQDRRIAFAMIALLAAEISAMPGTIHLTLPMDLGRMCIKSISVLDVALFGISAVIPQLMVVGLTIMKFFSGRKAGWGEIPIVTQLVRDDIILVTIIVIWVIIASIMTGIGDAYGYTGYAWLLSIIPSVSCRTVINFQKLALARSENGTYDQTRRRRAFGRGDPTTNSTSPTLTSIMLDSFSFQLPSIHSRTSIASTIPRSEIQAALRGPQPPLKFVAQDPRLESLPQR